MKTIKLKKWLIVCISSFILTILFLIIAIFYSGSNLLEMGLDYNFSGENMQFQFSDENEQCSFYFDNSVNELTGDCTEQTNNK